jgi:hypothetical protein
VTRGDEDGAGHAHCGQPERRSVDQEEGTPLAPDQILKKVEQPVCGPEATAVTLETQSIAEVAPREGGSEISGRHDGLAVVEQSELGGEKPRTMTANPAAMMKPAARYVTRASLV